VSQLLGVAYVDIRARLTNFENELRSGVQRSLAATSAEFAAGGAGVGRAADKMERDLKGRLSGFVNKSGLGAMAGQVSHATNAIGIPLKLGIAAAGAAVTYESIKMAGNFQSQMNLLVTAAGESSSAISGMGRQVMQIARDTGTSTTQLTAGLYNLEKAGYRTSAATHVLGIASEGARAEGANLATVVSGLTSVMQSYHVPASGAVNVMNEIIAAAGSSKTNMESFAGALATVIPIASAAHISFAEVGGAIATLTQHGTSANEATQELANLIRNLQAPSQVAQRAMNQLGLSITGIQQGLSNPKIGLQGTLDKIITTLGHHLGPAGLVAVSAFRQSQSATRDLRIEIDHMPSSLAKLSRGLIDGSVTHFQYLKAIRGTNNETYQLGRSFLQTITQASGFNSLLRSGSPAAQTFAGALKQLTGGSVGLNTTLQLTGENMPGLEARINRISEAARHGGQHIETWGHVQQSFNVEMGRLRQVVDTAFISIGQKMLPAIASASTATFNWFQHLGDGGSVFANAEKKFGPFAGGVLFIRTAFDTTTRFIRGTVFPVVENIGRVLAPVVVTIRNAGADVLNFANKSLTALGHVLNDTVGPALVSGAKFLGSHAREIGHNLVVGGQFVLILAGIGLAMRAYSAAVAGAAVVSAGFASVTTFLGLAMTAIKSGELVAFIGLYTESTIAATIATGAQAVMMGVVRVATIAWSVALAALDAAMVFLESGSIMAAINAFVVGSGFAAIATGAWTVATGALLTVMDLLAANPVVVLITALGLAIVGVVAIVTHGTSIMHAFGDVVQGIGNVFGDIMDVVRGFVDLVVGLFTLNPTKLLHGIEQIGEAILMLPVHVLQGVGKALLDLVGIHFNGFKIPIAFQVNTGVMQSANRMAAASIRGVTDEIHNMNAALTHTSVDQYGSSIANSITKMQSQIKVYSDLSKAVGGTKISVTALTTAQQNQAGKIEANLADFHTHTQAINQVASANNTVTVSSKQWNKALEDSHGDQTKAIALIREMIPNLNAYKSELTFLKTEQHNFNTAISSTATSLGMTKQQVIQYGNFLGYTGRQIAGGAAAQQRFKQAVAQARDVIAGASGPIGNFINQIFQYQNSAKTAADQTDLFKAAIDALTGKAQDVPTAIAQARIQLDDMVTSLKGVIGSGHGAANTLFNAKGTAIDFAHGGAQLQTQMGSLRDSLANVAVQTLNSGGSWQQAERAYENGVKNALPALQRQLGLSSTQVNTLNRYLQLTPAAKKILLSTPGLLQSTGGVQELLRDLQNLPSTKSIDIYLNTHRAAAKVSDIAQSRSANGNIFQAFANGGENHVAQIAPAGSMRLWAEPETGGEGYIPLAIGKRRRSESLMAQIAGMFGGMYMSPKMMHAMGFERFANGAFKGPGGKTEWKYNGIIYTTLIAYENAVTRGEKAKQRAERNERKAAEKLHATEVTDVKSLENAVSKMFKNTALTAQMAASAYDSAFARLEKAMASGNIKPSKAFTTMISGQNKTLHSLIDARNALAKRLVTANAGLAAAQTKYNDERSSVTATSMGTFDVTSAGNFNGYSTTGTVMQGLSAQLATIKTYSAGMKKLAAQHLNPTLLGQLAAAGPSMSANNQIAALLSATPKQFASINSMAAQAATASAGVGKIAADALYGAGVSTAKGLVAGLKSQENALNHTIAQLAVKMIREFKRQLGIKSPSTVFHGLGVFTGMGAVHGLTSTIPHMKNAAGQLAAAATRGMTHGINSHGAAAMHGGALTIVNHVHGAPGMNVDQLAEKVSHKQARQIRYRIPSSIRG